MAPPSDNLSNAPEMTVGELSARLKRTVEDTFGYVRVRGEISGLKRHTSGHVYLALKDQDAAMDAVIWKMTAARLGVKPEDGMEVIATGKLTTYPSRSKYQMVIDRLELAGMGAIMAMVEARKQKLAAEGLFAPEGKRPLPRLPQVIGVVTSPTGAVIRDILHRLRDRFPRRVLVWPVMVQGEGAAEQIAAAIEGFNRLDPAGPTPRPDLLIVARGGGSVEDLLPFSEEIVVRAAAASQIPLISAVGHETDTTLIDFASDRRAPTPTAAAEMAVPVRADLLAAVMEADNRLRQAVRRAVTEKRLRHDALARGLRRPQDMLAMARQRMDDMAERLPRALMQGVRHRRARYERLAAGIRPQILAREIAAERRAMGHALDRLVHAARRRLEGWRARLEARGAMLETLSYQATLQRGYALVLDAGGHPVTRAQHAQPAQPVTLKFQDGDRAAVIDGAPAPRAAKPKSSPPSSSQGSLL